MAGERYRRLRCGLWREVWFQALTAHQRNVYLYLRTGPQTDAVPGLCRFSPAMAAEDLGCTPRAVEIALALLAKSGRLAWDPKTRVTWVPDALEDQRPSSPLNFAGWGGALSVVPDCDVKRTAVERLFAYATTRGPDFVDSLRRSVGPEASPEAAPKAAPEAPLSKSNGNGTGTENSIGRGTGAAPPPPAAVPAVPPPSGISRAESGTGLAAIELAIFDAGIASGNEAKQLAKGIADDHRRARCSHVDPVTAIGVAARIMGHRTIRGDHAGYARGIMRGLFQDAAAYVAALNSTRTSGERAGALFGDGSARFEAGDDPDAPPSSKAKASDRRSNTSGGAEFWGGPCDWAETEAARAVERQRRREADKRTPEQRRADQIAEEEAARLAAGVV